MKSAGNAWQLRRSEGSTRQCPVRQRVWSCNGRLCPFWKEIVHRTDYSSCPVRHSTEGRNCLPRLSPTAPSCLGAIKGTPRRMEEDTKHSLSILKHPDSAPAHSLHCVSHPSFRAPRPGHEHNHQVCWDQVSHI
jgi:hypothetical protein